MNEGKVTVLIAEGGNGFEMPCRIFPDMETAKERCDELLGMEGKEIKEGFAYSIDLEKEEDPWPISKSIFTRFYYGCGGVYSFYLTEVGFDTKFVGFDLD